MRKSNIIEKDFSNPELGQLITPERLELDEARKLMVNITISLFEESEELGRTITASDREKIKSSIMTTALPELYRRLAAIQVQNPWALVKGLKKSGMGVRKDAAGNLAIDPEDTGGKFAGMGETVDFAEFVKGIETA